MAESTKRAVGRPPTPEQTERIKAACASTRTETAEAENLLTEVLGYQFRTVPAADNPHIGEPQVKSSRRDWRPIHESWNAMKQRLRDHGVAIGNPTVALRFEDAVSRLAWENRRPQLENLDEGRYPYYWEQS